MRPIYFLCFVLFFSVEAVCQTSSNIVGRWQVVVMDNGVRYDYKADTFLVSEALKDSLEKQNSDFWNVDYYISWAGSCRECYFVFGKDGSYQEYRETELRSNGTYVVNPADSTIQVVVYVNKNRIPKKYKYLFVGQRLSLHIPSFFRNDGLDLELERRD